VFVAISAAALVLNIKEVNYGQTNTLIRIFPAAQ